MQAIWRKKHVGAGLPSPQIVFSGAPPDGKKIPCGRGPVGAFLKGPHDDHRRASSGAAWWPTARTSDALAKRLAGGPATLYCGFDPTGDSLHVGSLVGQLMLRRFQLRGHRPITLAGGATGMIGDPSGKSAERNLLSREQLDRNLASIKAQLSRILDFDSKANPARMVDNASWTAGVGYLDFLRDIGKHFSVNMMVAKDSVRSRMEGDGRDQLHRIQLHAAPGA